ncbi:transcriptional regulator GcvA [Pseudochelatococcus sp. B33]
MSRLPPLNALKAFEAAARHLSFTRGAEALNVTQSAISHQVKLLEDYMGKPLFQRSPSGLSLTETGSALYGSVRDAFDMIAVAVDEAKSEPWNNVITIILRPLLSSNWLSPRLSRFYELHPDCKIRLNHTNGTVDFDSDDFDIAILAGDGNWPDVDVEFLMPCGLTPVCSPTLCGNDGKPQQLSDLRTNTLLHEGTYGNWLRWLALAGDASLGSRRHVFIDDTNVRIHAAINGQGVALSNPQLLAAEIEKGDLVAPFDTMLTNYDYYVVYRRKANREIRIFKDWLFEQAAA